jgi:hypothetical protein
MIIRERYFWQKGGKKVAANSDKHVCVMRRFFILQVVFGMTAFEY